MRDYRPRWRFIPSKMNLQAPSQTVCLSCPQRHTCIFLEPGSVCPSIRGISLGISFSERSIANPPVTM
jgi:hypothetical protein